MHSWHTRLCARIAPNCFASEKLAFGIPATSPFVSRSRSIFLSSLRLPVALSIRIVSRCRKRPIASKLSRPKPMGSISRWHDAQSWLASCSVIRWRRVSGRSAFASARFVSTFGGGGGTCWHSNCSRMKIPRCVGEVSVGPALAARKDASPNRPERGEPPGKRTNSNCPDGAGSL